MLCHLVVLGQKLPHKEYVGYIRGVEESMVHCAHEFNRLFWCKRCDGKAVGSRKKYESNGGMWFQLHFVEGERVGSWRRVHELIQDGNLTPLSFVLLQPSAHQG